MKLTGKRIFILSPEAWGVAFVSKHHYAVELAGKGNDVFFINPPSTNSTIKKINGVPNLQVVDYRTSLRGTNRLPGFLRNWICRRDANKIIKICAVKPDIIWSFDPFRFQNMNCFGGAKIKIYHPVDVHYTPLEQEAIRTADIVFSTADKILERFSSPTPQYFINHGLAKHFLDSPTYIDFQTDSSSINIGYVGNLHYKFLDTANLKKIVEQQSQCKFYFIGPFKGNNLSAAEKNTELINWLQQQQNVALLGAKPSKELPAYLAQMDMFFMCYTGDKNVAHMANPHKILEYLSTGKVTLTHYIDEYNRHRDLVEMVDNNKDLPSRFQKIIQKIEDFNSPEKQKIRRIFAQNNSYNQHLTTIESYLSKHITTS